MGKYASEVIRQARTWLGCNESDGTHKAIIDVYNKHKPLARGYKVKYTDSWCATFVSAVAIKLGYTDIIPTECGCPQMVNKFKALGCWEENENRKPNVGDIIFYDWEDNGKGDNLGAPNHVGIVEKVSGVIITVIEGNYSNSVKRRTMAINGKYIRGYGVPKYDTSIITDEADQKVLEWQRAAIKDGFKFPKHGADGIWGEECEDVAEKAICKKLLIGYKNKNLTKIIQKAVGVTDDGKYGAKTRGAVIGWQTLMGLEPDGVVGYFTWKKILGVK